MQRREAMLPGTAASHGGNAGRTMVASPPAALRHRLMLTAWHAGDASSQADQMASNVRMDFTLTLRQPLIHPDDGAVTHQSVPEVAALVNDTSAPDVAPMS